MSYGDPAPEVEATTAADTEGEAVNPPLPDGGPSDGSDDSATDQVPGEH